MKHLLTSLFLFFALEFAGVSYHFALAQPASSKDIRQFNMAILNIIDEYEEVVSFSEKKDHTAFTKLFANPDADCVYNDIIGTEAFQQTISPKRYSDNVPNDGSVLIRTVISNVKKDGDVTVENGVLHRSVSFSKYIMIIDASVYTQGEGGVLFDSSQSLGDQPDFRLIMDFSYDPYNKKCLITSIRSAETKEKSPFDEKHFTIVTQSSDKYDKHLVSGGKPLKFNGFKQAVAYYNDIDIDNPDIYVEPVEYAANSHYNVMGLKYKPMYLRFKAYGDFTLGKAYDLTTSYSGINSSSSSFQCGIDFGAETSLNRIWRVGIYTGAGLCLGKIGLSSNDIEYTLTYPVPVRLYKFRASETLKLTDLYIPVYLENEFTLMKNLVLDIDLGARFYLNSRTDLGPYNVVGQIGNQQVDASFNAFVDPANYTRTMYDITIYGCLEVDYCIVKRLLYVYAAYGYEYGLKPSYDAGATAYFSPTDNIFPFYYSPIADKDYPFRSLIGAVSYKRKASLLSVGVKFKF